MNGRGEENSLAGFCDVYYQEFRPQGTVLYTGEDILPEPYSDDGYPKKDSTTYQYTTFDEPFSTRTIIFKIPMSYLRRR
ncbi:hypothetical protein NEDG_01703 [Nematocida displodere]|uniref:Uncharacterized protein n=1 Tax=Nematocida displodere TaxID=1805483 RepID=A0A177EFD2_9MICR|nr:hypothetical protein NEDG_01703 [Nematocida displodere]